MSRLSQSPVKIPQGVTWELKDRDIFIKGAKGNLSLSVPNALRLDPQDDGIWVRPASSHVDAEQEASALLGTYFRLIENMVVGVSQGFEKELQLVGVGYRAELQGNTLKLALGYSHDVFYPIPENITVEVKAAQKQGDMPVTYVVIRGADKQTVGQIASELQRHRPPEPYKGKGFHIKGQFVHRKESKK